MSEPIVNTEQLPKPFMTIIDAPHSVWKVGFNCHGNDLSKHIGTHLYTHSMRELSMSEIDKHFNQSWYQDDNGVHFDHYGFATSLIKASRGEK